MLLFGDDFLWLFALNLLYLILVFDIYDGIVRIYLDHGVDVCLHLLTLYTLLLIDIFRLHPPHAHPAHECLNNEVSIVSGWCCRTHLVDGFLH